MNGAYILVKSLEELGVEHVFGYTGAAGYLRSSDKVGGAIVASGSVITDIDEMLYPVVRPGGSYADMELGPYIREIP